MYNKVLLSPSHTDTPQTRVKGSSAPRHPVYKGHPGPSYAFYS